MNRLRAGLLAMVCLLPMGCVSENAPEAEPLDLMPATSGAILTPTSALRIDSSGVASLGSRSASTSPKCVLIDLPNALAVVGARSVDVRLAQAKTAEARQGIYAAVFSFFPELLPAMDFRLHRDLLQNTTGQFLDVNKQAEFGGIGAAADWQAGNVVFRALAAARRTDAAEAATDTARANATLAVAVGYYELVRTRTLVRIADRALEAAQELARDQDMKEKRGAGIKADVLQAKAEVARQEFQRSQATVAVATASARLAASLELAPDVELVPTDETPLPVQLISDDITIQQLLDRAETSRPELRESSHLIVAARREHQRTVWGPLVPELNAGGDTGVLGPTYGHSSATNDVYATVGWKIGPGGLGDFTAMNASAAREQQERLREEALRIEISRQVVEARANVTGAFQELVSAQQGILAAREALRLQTERFQKGAGIVLEVLEAQRALTTAETNDVEAIVHFDRAQYSLLRAIGEPINNTSPPR